MTFLHPLWLLGASAVVAPILVHLLRRQQVREVRWAAMRFLLAAYRQNRARSRLQELLLLAVRCLILVCLALAFARPHVGAAAGGLAGLARRDRLIVVDRSMSMGARHQGMPLLDQAKEVALRILDAAAAGDRFGVVAVPAPDGTGVLPLGTDPVRVASFVRGLSPAPSPLDWSAFWEGVRGACGAAGEALPPGVEVTVLTDLQAVSWAPERIAADRERWDAWTKAGPWRVASLGIAQENLALSQARLPSGIPVAGAPQQLGVRVARFGGTGTAAVSVSLEGPQAPPPRPAQVPPDDAQWVVFPLRPADAGYPVYRAHIPPDVLAADDELPVVLPVLDRLTLLLVDGEPGSGPALESETVFLRLALEADPERPDAWQASVVDAGSLAVADVDAADLVVLANVPSLPVPVAERLRLRVREGMGLIHFLGDRTDGAFWSDSPLGPGTLEGIRGGRRTEEPYWEIVPVAATHPMVRAQRDPEAFLDRALVWGHWRLGWDALAARGGQAVLGLADGSPYLVQHAVGEGLVLTVLGSADQEWNNLPANADFVPWMREMVHTALRPALGRWNRTLGAEVTIPIPAAWAGKEISLILPSGLRERLTPHQGEGGGWNVKTLPLREPGVARLRVDGEEVRAVAVRTDEAESDLRRADLADLRRALPAVVFEEGPSVAQAVAAGGAEVTRAFLYAALALAILEVFLARRAGRG